MQVPAAVQTLAILRAVGRSATPVRAAALVRDLGLPRSTTYHLLDTLVEAGFLVHLKEIQRYGLGVAAYELGAAYTRQAPLAQLARGPLEALVARVRENAHLAVLDGRDVVYVLEERAAGRPALVTDVGVRLPAHLTASGRALLAALSASQVRALYPDATALVARTEVVGPRSPSALRSLLGEVRRAGYATEDGEVSPGFASVAVAVTDHAGRPVAAVAVTHPAPGSPGARPLDPDRVVDAVGRTAAEITRRLRG